MSKKKHIRRNFIAALISRGGRSIQQILLVPIFLTYWEPEYYGHWLVLSTLPALLSMSDLGLGTAASTKIVIELGQDKYKEAKTILSSSLVLILFLSLFFLLIFLILPQSFLKHVLIGEVDAAKTVFLLLMVSVVPQQMAKPFEGFLIYEGRAPILHYMKAFESLFEICAIYILLTLGSEAFAIAIVLVMSRLLSSTGLFVLSLKNQSLPSLRDFDFKSIKSLLNVGLGFQLSIVWQLILFQGTVIVAKMVIGPTGAVIWSSIRTFSRSCNQGIYIVNQAYVPEIQREYSFGNLEKVRVLHCIALVVVFGLASIMSILLVTFGPSLFLVWTRGRVEAPEQIWIFVAVALLAHSLWFTSSMVLRAVAKPWKMNIIAVTCAMLSLIIGWLLTREMGSVVGMAIGAMSFELVMAVSIILIVSKEINDNLAKRIINNVRQLWSILKTRLKII